MLQITYSQVDEMHRLNAKFRHCEACYYEHWSSHGVRLDLTEVNTDVHCHAKNTRFELMLDTALQAEYDDYNFIILDGRTHSIHEFDSWEEIKHAIEARL